MKPSTRRTLCVSAAAALLASTAGPLWARKPKDAARPAEEAAPVWSPFAAWTGRQVYLGPTGARGWVGDGRIIVTSVPEGSPAEGLLRVGDVLVEAGGRRLADDEDPRRAVGEAITAAETTAAGGKLRLSVLRAGRRRDVTVPIRVMGGYSRTWPHDCAKSRRILDEACAYLAREQFPDGHVEGEGIMATAWSALLWLAADDVRYLDNARRAVYHLSKTDYVKHELRSWALGYGGIAMAEYYLATGDESVLPKLQEMIRFTESGQMACGTWGHNIPWGAYGALNQAGLVCWMMLALGQECGLEIDQAVLDKSTLFFGKYVGRGGIPYGDHLPTTGSGSNGKDALGAVGFHLLGKPEGWRFFSRLVAAAYRYREKGHTGCFLSLYWGPVAARLAGEKPFRRFMDYQRWYYDLARTPDGGLVCQPNPENLSGRTNGVYTRNGPRFTTGGMAMVYAIPQRAVRVLGAERGVFGRALTGPIAEARKLYGRRKWPELAAAVAEIRSDAKASADQKRWAAQLAKAADRQRESVTRTLAKFDKLVREGDVYHAHELLGSLQRRIGADAGELAAAKETMEANSRWVETGREYYDAWAKLQSFTWQGWHYYGKKLMDVPGPFVPPPIRTWLPVAPTSEAQPQPWRLTQWGDDLEAPPDASRAPDGWADAAFDDSAWAEGKGAVRIGSGRAVWQKRNMLLRRAFELDDTDFATLRLLVAVPRDLRAAIYLNGRPILRVEPGPWKGYAKVPLAPATVRLLRKGRNVLAVRGERGPRGGTFDVGIEGLRHK